MARIGGFLQPDFTVGAPLSIIQPADNKFPQFDPEIEALKGLSAKDALDLQSQIDELSATLVLARDS